MTVQSAGHSAALTDDELALWRRYAKDREPELRNQLVERYLPLARMVAASLFARRGGSEVEFADYLQVATLGLIEAVTRFDVERQVRFATFAVPRMRGAVLNSLSELSEKYAQYSLRKRLGEERLASLREGRSQSDNKDLFAELAEVAIGLALSYLLEDSGMLAREESSGFYKQDFYHNVAHQQLRESVMRLVDALPEKERRVVRYHYYQGLSFTEIAELCGLTKGRISQLHHQALRLLREAQSASGGLALSI